MSCTDSTGIANPATAATTRAARAHFHWVKRIIRNMSAPGSGRRAERAEELDEALLEVQVHHLAQRGARSREPLLHCRLPPPHGPDLPGAVGFPAEKDEGHPGDHSRGGQNAETLDAVLEPFH